MLVLSARGISDDKGCIDLLTGTDSPVRADSSTCKLRSFSSLKSAGTLSPDANNTISPGTKSCEGIRRVCPSRRTFTSVVTVLAKEAIAPSACASCT